MINNSGNSQILADYHLDQWLNQSRIDSLKSRLTESLDVLLAADVLDQFLCAWSELEIFSEIKCFPDIIHKLEDKDTSFENILNSLNDFKNHRRDFVIAWASCHWSNRLENMYLAKKELLEKVSFSMINVAKNELAFEIYYRINSGEETFLELYRRYSLNQEKSPVNGFYSLKPIKMFPAKMHPFLRRLSSGEVLKPFSNGKQFSILMMDSWNPALFDEATKNLLLYDEFSIWQQELLVRIKSNLSLPN